MYLSCTKTPHNTLSLKTILTCISLWPNPKDCSLYQPSFSIVSMKKNKKEILLLGRSLVWKDIHEKEEGVFGLTWQNSLVKDLCHLSNSGLLLSPSSLPGTNPVPTHRLTSQQSWLYGFLWSGSALSWQTHESPQKSARLWDALTKPSSGLTVFNMDWFLLFKYWYVFHFLVFFFSSFFLLQIKRLIRSLLYPKYIFSREVAQ